MEIKIKLLKPEAVVPKYANPGDAGFDFVSLEDVEIYPGQTKVIQTGLSFEIPDGFELQVRPRSGLSLKTFLRVSNSPGTVDSSFRGEVGVLLSNTAPYGMWDHLYGDYKIKISKGDRIAQGVICPVVRGEFVIEDVLSETIRGDGKFGSTGD